MNRPCGILGTILGTRSHPALVLGYVWGTFEISWSDICSMFEICLGMLKVCLGYELDILRILEE